MYPGGGLKWIASILIFPTLYEKSLFRSLVFSIPWLTQLCEQTAAESRPETQGVKNWDPTVSVGVAQAAQLEVAGGVWKLRG